MTRTKFSPEMEPEVRNEKYQGWKKARETGSDIIYPLFTEQYLN